MYRTIESSFWSDPKVRALSHQAKLVFLYLITNDRSHVSGIYYLPKAVMEMELGLTSDTLSGALQTLTRSQIIMIDQEREVFWVKNLMRYQGKGKKNLASAYRQLLTLHNSPLIKDFCKAYPKVRGSKPDRVSKVRRDSSQEQEQEQEQNQEQETSITRADEDFDSFWREFPSLRKQGKGAALKAWKVALRKTSAAALLEAVREYAKSPVGNGQFVKGPVPWLNQECWNDDRAAWQRSDSGSKPSSMFAGPAGFASEEQL